MMKTMIPPQVRMRLRIKKKKKKRKKRPKSPPNKKKKGQIKKGRPNKKNKKNEGKREKGQCYYLFSTLVLRNSTMIFMIESLLCCHFHILSGNFSL